MRFVKGAPAKGLVFVIVVVAGIYVAYLIVANLALASGLIAGLIGDGRSRALEYKWPLSLWPGRVHLQTVRLRNRDRNVEWQVEIKHADLTIELRPLLHREIRIDRLRGDRVQFRLRLRFHGPVNERRARAFPPIPGFEFPPLAPIGPPAPPLSDAQYHLWTIHLARVDVGVDEIWIDVFRFDGTGRARGALLLKPQRWVHVSSPDETPARLDIEKGGITVDARPMLADLHGFVDCIVPGFDPRQVKGMGVFRFISASSTLRGRLRGLSWAGAFLAPDFSGEGEDGSIELSARMRDGRLDPSSVLVAALPSAELRDPSIRLSGSPALRIAVDSSRGRPLVRSTLAVRGADILATDPFPFGVHLPELLTVADNDALDLAGRKPLVAASLRALQGSLRDARIFGVTANGAIAAEIGLVSPRAMGSNTDPGAGTNPNGQKPSDPDEEPPNDLSITGSWLNLPSVRVTRKGESVEDRWWGQIKVARGILRTAPTLGVRARLEGLFQNATPAFAALSAEGKLPSWVESLVKTGNVNGTASIRWTAHRFEICPFHLTSGILTVRGFSQRIASETNGLVVLKAGPLSFNFDIGRGDTSKARACKVF